MATNILTFDILARDRASAAFNKIGREADKSSRHVDRTGKSFTGLSSRLGVFSRVGPRALTLFSTGLAALGVAGVVKGLGSFVSEAREAQKVGASTAQGIKTIGASSWTSVKAISSLSQATSEKIGVDDELIQTSANLLLTFKNIKNAAGANNDIFNRSVVAAQDLAAKGFGNANTAAKMLGKALNDPLKGITALGRAGVTFSDKQKKLIASFVEQGDILSAQKIIMKEVEAQVGGTAEATATAADKMRVKWQNFQEMVGNKLVPIIDKYLIPALSTIVTFISSKVVPAIGRFSGVVGTGFSALFAAFKEGDVTSNGFVGAMERVGVALRGVVDWVRGSLVPALQDLARNVGPVILIIFSDIGKVLQTVVVPALAILGGTIVKVVIPAISGLAKWISKNKELIPAVAIAIGVLLVPAFIAWAVAAGSAAVATIAAAAPVIALGAVVAAAAFLIIKHWDTIKGAFVNAFNWVKNNWPLLLGILTGPFGLAIVEIIKHRDTIWNAFKSVYNWFKNTWDDIYGFVVDVFNSAKKTIQNIAIDIARAFLNTLSTIVNAAAKLPGPLGAPFRKAKGHIDDAKRALDGLQRKINMAHGKELTIKVKMQMRNRLKIAAAQGVALTISGKPIALAAGGPIRGPGGPTGDKIPAMLSDGEYVIKADRARKLGTQFLDVLNGAKSIGGDPAGMTLGFATGGLVGKAQAFVRAQANDPYIWGGVGPNGFDCSGLVGAAWAVLRGLNPFRRYFTTASNMASFGFKPGTGAFTIGVNPYTHMAGNIGGLPFEAANTRSGIHVGSGAQSVLNFAKKYYLAALGGVFGGNASVNLGPSDLRKLMKAITINWGVPAAGRNMVSYEAGTRYVPRTGAYRLHRGEAVIPADQNNGGRITLELRSSGSRLDDLLLEMLRRSIRVKGGNVQVVLGS